MVQMHVMIGVIMPYNNAVSRCAWVVPETPARIYWLILMPIDGQKVQNSATLGQLVGDVVRNRDELVSMLTAMQRHGGYSSRYFSEGETIAFKVDHFDRCLWLVGRF